MNRKVFVVVIVLMSIALTGIVGVQILWVNNAVNVKNIEFDRIVLKVLNKVVAKLEEQRNIQYITSAISPQSYNKGSQNDTIITQISSFDNKISTIKISAIDKNFNSDVKISLNNRNSIIDNISDFKKPTLIGDSIKKLLVSSEIDSLDKIINNHIAKKFKGINGLLEKMIVEFNISTGVKDKELDLSNVKELIHNELENNGILLPFEYAVAISDTIIDSSSKEFKKKYLLSKYKVKLFPDDIFNKNEFLFIGFPTKYSLVFNSISILLFASIFFTIVIILTFWITIRVILKQKKISEIKTDFINNMTHEFKTPIATISLAVDSIKNPKILNNKEHILRFTNIIKEENKRMNNQVESVLQMSLIEKQDFNLDFERLDIHEIILSAVKNISLQIETKNGVLRTNLEATNSFLYVDSLHFSNIIYNLLDNANKYSPISPEISISTKNAENGILIIIKDNGIGMNKEEQGKIFDKFFRIHTGNVHNIKGFGLGLSYVSVIVAKFSGTITVNSEKDEGSTFEMFFPFVISEK